MKTFILLLCVILAYGSEYSIEYTDVRTDNAKIRQDIEDLSREDGISLKKVAIKGRRDEENGKVHQVTIFEITVDGELDTTTFLQRLEKRTGLKSKMIKLVSSK